MLPQISFVPIGCPNLLREEVPILVAKEFTNRQIVSELMLSEHTVATHVRNAFKKLGLSSRTQIAAYFREQP